MKQIVRTILASALGCGLTFTLIAESPAQTISQVDAGNPKKVSFLLDSIKCMIKEDTANYSLETQFAEIGQAESLLRELIFQENSQIWNRFLERYRLIAAYLNQDDISPYQKANLDPEYYANNREYFALDGPMFADIRRHFYDFRRQYFFSPQTIYINFIPATDPGFADQKSTGQSAGDQSAVSYFHIAIDTAAQELTVFSVNGK